MFKCLLLLFVNSFSNYESACTLYAPMCLLGILGINAGSSSKLWSSSSCGDGGDIVTERCRSDAHLTAAAGGAPATARAARLPNHYPFCSLIVLAGTK